MFFETIKEFFWNMTFWQRVVAGLFVAAIIGVVSLIGFCTKRKEPIDIAQISTSTNGEQSPALVAVGSEITQKVNIDSSDRKGGIHINQLRVESGGTLILNTPDYQDDIILTEIIKVRELYQQGRVHYIKEEFQVAIEKFKICLDLEKDFEKRGALNFQIGNCYYNQRFYLKSAEFYSAGLRESIKSKDSEGQAANYIGLGNTYIDRAVSTGKLRGNNIGKAVEYYKKALEIYKKDMYPVEYALTQNNIGTAYKNFPADTTEQRAENVRKSINCYREALEIYKKDEYPVEYAAAKNNLGIAYKNFPAETEEQRAVNVRKAIDCYNEALEIRKKDEYPVDYATSQNNLGNAFKDLPAETPEQRAENGQKAIDCYREALEVYNKDEYPLGYAATKNNLGTAYMYLPAETAEQRAENVRKAIDCYRDALDIRKKDEYPHDYCSTAANIGMALASLGDKINACYWLREAYALREYLEEQGKGLEELIGKVCE